MKLFLYCGRFVVALIFGVSVALGIGKTALPGQGLAQNPSAQGDALRLSMSGAGHQREWQGRLGGVSCGAAGRSGFAFKLNPANLRSKP
jgi:hypothetical protein